MRRRDFIKIVAGSAITWPLAAPAQQGERVRRIGLLAGLAEDDPEQIARTTAFRQGLAGLGWVEGRNARVDIRFAPSRTQLQALARELTALQPDVIVAVGTGMVAAVQRETKTIPIVFVGVSDPIGSGFVASLARPGGNLTGQMSYEESIVGKLLRRPPRRSTPSRGAPGLTCAVADTGEISRNLGQRNFPSVPSWHWVTTVRYSEINR